VDLIQGEFYCAACGEPNDLTVDPSGGAEQSYVEDCQVCCRPNVLTIRCNFEDGHCVAEAVLEGD